MVYQSINYKVGQKYDIQLIHNNSTNYYAPSCWHNSIELLLCYSGLADVKIGSKEHQINKDEILFINSTKAHSIKSNHPFVILTLTINKECLGTYQEIFPSLEFNTEQTKDNFQDLISLRCYIEELRALKQQTNIRGIEFRENVCINDIIYLLLTKMEISNSNDNSFRKSKRFEETISNIMLYIEKNYEKPLTLEDTAKSFSYSTAYFSKFFRKHTGMSYTEYLTNARLKHAYFDLIMTDLSITKIALKNGFANSRAFSTYFKRVYGNNPQEYRNIIQSEKRTSNQ
ncbi:AraC family transcriptional regulator [Lactobacillus sp. ESL0684]|uniref:AraC family transcriptional regulator n=1 Tax=Lactobacillus sp. ESL0684 TaxID=2983213 RepID=UPI0023F73067|nr:AraC family transcriptional regulator [Lactobacillus sp. ESL0684]WEV43578.1 AraC family transcriptional regulator [Lactobacillus sp. ESL0684]